MLIQRILTSIALLVLILAAVFYLPPGLFFIFIGTVISISIWEWSALAGFEKISTRIIYLICMLVLLWLSLHAPIPAIFYFVSGILFWMVAFLLIYSYKGSQSPSAFRAIFALVAVPLFVPGWLAFVWLREQPYHAFHLLLLFALVASADIGAYFTGKSLGRHKLAVNVSPNKTWEGFCGGMLMSAIVISFTGYFLISPVSEVRINESMLLILCAMIIAAFSVIGDLFESLVKRFRNVKDSGSILPGHGGILDRIDGLTAAAPVYAMLVLFLGPLFPGV